jgi:hypothetical protein
VLKVFAQSDLADAMGKVASFLVVVAAKLDAAHAARQQVHRAVEKVAEGQACDPSWQIVEWLVEL